MPDQDKWLPDSTPLPPTPSSHLPPESTSIRSGGEGCWKETTLWNNSMSTLYPCKAVTFIQLPSERERVLVSSWTTVSKRLPRGRNKHKVLHWHILIGCCCSTQLKVIAKQLIATKVASYKRVSSERTPATRGISTHQRQ